MRYRNPRISEPTHRPSEGRDFLILLAGVAGLVVVLGLVALVTLEALATRVPFSVERRLADSVIGPRAAVATKAQPADQAADQAAERALKELVGRVAGAMQLPEGMTITVHYVPTPTVNAMATLGGHVFVFRGLVGKLKSEDALATVLAHEIGHVRERHVVRAMGRGVALLGVLAMVGIRSQGLNRWVLDKGGELTALSYSRDAERDADRAALEAVHRLYGHVGGTMELFDLFRTMEAGGAEMLRSHPLAAHRRQELELVARKSAMATGGALRPLPPELQVPAAAPAPTVAAASGNAPASAHGSELR